jgi:hypothetical protein
VHRLALLDQGGQGVGELDLPAPARRGPPQHLEDLRGQHVAADDRQAARRLVDRRLLDQAGDGDDVGATGLDGDRAVLVDVLAADVEQRDDRAAVLGLHLEHLLQQVVAGVDDVVAQQDRERLVPDEGRRLQHRVPEPAGLALPHEVDLGHLGGGVHRGEPVGVPLLLQRRLELGLAVEEVLDRGLVAAGHHEHLAESGAGGLLHDVLQRGPVDHRQQLLGHGLGGREEAGAHARDGDDGLPRRAGAGSRHARSVASRDRAPRPPGHTPGRLAGATRGSLRQ